VTVTSGRAF